MRIEEKNGIIFIDGFDVMEHIRNLERVLNKETMKNRKAFDYVKNLEIKEKNELLKILEGVEKDENN